MSALRPTSLLLSLIVAGAALAGCMGGQAPSPSLAPTPTTPAVVEPLVTLTVATAAGELTAHVASGAISDFTLPKDAKVDFPQNVFHFQEKKFFASKTLEAKAGQPFQLLLPPGMTELTLTIGGTPTKMPVTHTGHTLVQGENMLEWFKIQRDQFPNRCAGCPNYAKSQQYFANLFRSFGYTNVEVDPYGTNALHAQFANVVATKYPKTDATHPLWIGTGGHYDVVTGTVEGALDDTSGTLGALELARVFANLTTTHNMVFGLWGGEESGLQGSAFFTKTNPNIAAQMETYVNLDASAFSWPAPMPRALDGSEPECSKLIPLAQQSATAPVACPDPVLVTAGPDGPRADILLNLAKKIQKQVAVGWTDAYFLYEYVAQGQAQGYARLNAQSDHTSFIAAGVPSYMLINGDITKNPVGFHNKRDTIDNWTKYAYHNWYVDLEEELSPEERAEAERLVVASLETYLWIAFYIFLHYDVGLVDVVPR